ncbi:MAG: hypothetical protein JO372_02310 [Solirubrobacterales bacterium]|nr:hypothetical protein [Solirubrobacterales bacterium]
MLIEDRSISRWVCMRHSSGLAAEPAGPHAPASQQAVAARRLSSNGGAAWMVRLAARRAPDPVEGSLPARFVAGVRWRTSLSALRDLGAGDGCG